MLKFAKNWILPPAVQALLSKIRHSAPWAPPASRPVLEDHNVVHLQRNRSLRGIGTGTRCFILGTGPSLNDVDVRTLEGEHCIGLNSAYHHPDFSRNRSRYTIVSGLACHPHIQGEAANAWLKQLADNTAGRPVFLNILDLEAIGHSDLFGDHEIYYFDFSRPASELSNRGIDLTESLYTSQNVLMMATQVAIGMGFSTIILLGIDHDMILHVANKQATHFYNPEVDALERAGMFDYNGPFEDFGFWFSAYSQMWDQYRILNSFARQNEITILNASTRSLLDVFPRARLEDLI